VILVTGATGNVGGELIGALLDANQDVRALTRRERPPTLPHEVEAVAADLNQPEALADALSGVSGLFLLPGYDDMPGILDQARSAGVERVVLLSGGSATAADTDNVISAYMIRSEEAVRESGVSWTILRPSGFMSNTLRWLPQLREGDVVREPFADVPVAMIDPHDIAAVAAIALRSAEHAGETYELSGPEALLPADRARILGEAIGREIHVQALSTEEAREQMTSEMSEEYVDAFFSFYAEGTLDESQVLPTVERIVGREPRTFEQWTRAHAEAFR
jgi:uncharacterized protein YbjT (DUF2867 family)